MWQLVEADELDESPTLYITNTENDAVEFKINDGPFATFNAGQEVGSIKFSFEAVNTSIRDGQVRFTLPKGWTPAKAPSTEATQKLDTLGELTISGGGYVRIASGDKKKTSVSVGRTITVGVLMLEKGDAIDITINGYTDETTKIVNNVKVQSDATDDDEYEEITGYFWTSKPIRGRGHNAGKVEVEITNAADGSGNATISRSSVKAGSDEEEITIDFTAAGTMDGGSVRLRIPNGWGDLQDDDATEANYVEVDVVKGRGKVTANVANRAVIANIETLAAGGVIRFTYGGGTVDSRNGAEVQPAIASAKDPAVFVIESDGDGDGGYDDVVGMQRTAAQQKADGESKEKPLGAVYDTDKGSLFVAVTGADDGSGSAEVEIVSTGQGEGEYPDDQDSDGDGNRTEVLDDLMRIHAGDMGTYLKFIYTPSQTIQNGQLKFEVQGEWSDPQNNTGTPGYTEIYDTGTADIDHIEFDENDRSVTVDIAEITPEGTIEIHYGSYEGSDDGSGAEAPTATSTSSPFTIQIKGGDATTNRFSSIKTLKGKTIAVRVYSQASGGGNVSASVSDNKNEGNLGAGDTDREVTVIYTAAGEINDGMLKLTVPPGWSHPTDGER